MLTIITCEKTRRKVLLIAVAACIGLFLCLAGIILAGDETGVMNARTESSGFYTQRPAARRIEKADAPLRRLQKLPEGFLNTAEDFVCATDRKDLRT